MPAHLRAACSRCRSSCPRCRRRRPSRRLRPRSDRRSSTSPESRRGGPRRPRQPAHFGREEPAEEPRAGIDGRGHALLGCAVAGRQHPDLPRECGPVVVDVVLLDQPVLDREAGRIPRNRGGRPSGSIPWKALRRRSRSIASARRRARRPRRDRGSRKSSRGSPPRCAEEVA